MNTRPLLALTLSPKHWANRQPDSSADCTVGVLVDDDDDECVLIVVYYDTLIKGGDWTGAGG